MMYLSRDQQKVVFSHIKKVLAKHGGFFMHEDILKFHPELRQHPGFTRITSRLKSIAGNNALEESFTQKDVTEFYEGQGFIVKRPNEDIQLDIESYPESVQNDAQELQNADFRMWKLYLA